MAQSTVQQYSCLYREHAATIHVLQLKPLQKFSWLTGEDLELYLLNIMQNIRGKRCGHIFSQLPQIMKISS